MPQARVALKAQKADKYLTTLSKHFAKKVAVDTQEQMSKVYFPMGTCQMNLSDNTISFLCEAEEEEALATVQHIISAHITMLKEFKECKIEWQCDN